MRVALKSFMGPLALVGLLMVGNVVPASAQIARAQSEQRLRDAIAQMEQDLRDLERYVYNSPRPAAPPSGDVGILGPAADGTGANLPATALLSERVDNLDVAVRTLTGEVEELNYRVNQLSQRIETVVADLDLRLRTLEGNAGPSTYSSTTAPSAGPREMDIARVPAPTSEVDAGFVPPAGSVGAPQTLGVVSAARLSGSEEADFEIGMQLLRQGDFDGAENTFQDFISGYPDSSRLGEAHFWLGESLYVRGLYADAAAAYLSSARDYGDGEKAPDSLLKLGMSLAALGQTDQACSAFDQVARSYPNASDRVTRNVARERSANNCN